MGRVRNKEFGMKSGQEWIMKIGRVRNEELRRVGTEERESEE